MPNIETTEDLLRLLDDNPEFLEAVRTKILTEELLKLPARFDAFQERTDKNFGDLRQDLGGIRTDIRELHGLYSRQHDDYDRFRGAYSENAARKDDGIVASSIARARGNRVLTTRRLDRDEMSAIFVQAVEGDMLDDIDDESQDRFANAADVLLVRERNRSRSQFYMVIEASHTAHRNDLTRVSNHAKIIARVTGLPAYGIVAGTRIGQNMPAHLLQHDPVTFVQERNPTTRSGTRSGVSTPIQ